MAFFVASMAYVHRSSARSTRPQDLSPTLQRPCSRQVGAEACDELGCELSERDRAEPRGDVAIQLTGRATASGTDWAVGLAARSHALVVGDEGADDLYVEAIEHLTHTRVAVDLARAHLLYGEWLRRQNRRVDAREQLRIAYDMFTGFGMEAFAERTRIELLATGEHPRRRTVETLGQLTPQEEQISRLVAQGNTNREIAAPLFISPSTVEYQLHKAFRKLGVRSRTELARRMA
jgi:DNA-binding CsgD family transcriptional regulator